jgi:hypothetical protein
MNDVDKVTVTVRQNDTSVFLMYETFKIWLHSRRSMTEYGIYLAYTYHYTKPDPGKEEPFYELSFAQKSVCQEGKNESSA